MTGKKSPVNSCVLYMSRMSFADIGFCYVYWSILLSLCLFLLKSSVGNYWKSVLLCLKSASKLQLETIYIVYMWRKGSKLVAFRFLVLS